MGGNEIGDKPPTVSVWLEVSVRSKSEVVLISSHIDYTSFAKLAFQCWPTPTN